MISPNCEVKRTLWGTILHSIAAFYFFTFPVSLFIFLAVDPEGIPAALASFSWVTYLNFSLMLFFAASIGFGLFRPLSKWVRWTIGGFFSLSIIINIASIIVVAIQFDEISDVVSTSLNIVFLGLLAAGLLLGYTSKVAKYLLPFRIIIVEEESYSGSPKPPKTVYDN